MYFTPTTTALATASATATATAAPITTSAYAIYDASTELSETTLIHELLGLFVVCILSFLLIQWEYSLSSMKTKNRSQIEIVIHPFSPASMKDRSYICEERLH